MDYEISTPKNTAFVGLFSVPEQYAVLKSIALHLIPGAVILLVFIALTTWTDQQNLPTPLALLIAWILAGIPVELGILIYQGYKRNRRFSLEGVILYQQPMAIRQHLWLIPLLLIWAIVVLGLLTPFASRVFSLLFSWWPKQMLLSDFPQNLNRYSPTVLWLVVLLSGMLNIVVPYVEELYFRGYLLPRMSYMNKWAPLLNVTLFSLYHFWLPWEFFSRVIALFPMVYVVWWKRNIYPGIWVHILLNSLGTIGLLVLIMGQN